MLCGFVRIPTNSHCITIFNLYPPDSRAFDYLDSIAR